MVTVSMQAAAVAILGDGARGRQIFAELMDRARSAGEPYWVAFLVGFGMACTAAGIDLGATAMLGEGLVAAAASGVPSLHAFLAVGQGYVAASAHPAAALGHLRRGAALANAAGCTYLRDYALIGLTALDARPSSRDLPQMVVEAQRWLDAGDHFQVLVHVLNIADTLQAAGRTEAAQRLRSAAGNPLSAGHANSATFHRVVALAARLADPAALQEIRTPRQAAEHSAGD